MNIQDISEVFSDYVMHKHLSELNGLIANGGGSLFLSLVDLIEFDSYIFDSFLNDGRQFFKTLQATVDKMVNAAISDANGTCNSCRIACKIHDLPSCPEICYAKAPRARDVGKLIQFTGIVVGMTQATIINFQRTFCCSKCRYVFTQEVDILDKTFSCKPTHCRNPDTCSGRTFTERKNDELDITKQRLRNFQELIVQELAAGDAHLGTAGEASRSMPGSVTVLLMDSLVDSCKPGDWVSLIGIVENRWKSASHMCHSEIETVLIASSLNVLSSSVDQSLPYDMETEDDEFRFFWTLGVDRQLASRDQIIASICPRLYGLYPLKLAIALMLLGGSSSPGPAKTVTKRSEIHILLVGDPGTGKSQLLGFARKLARRSVLTTGVGTSAAGLTVAAVQTATGWSLEPGALLLADRGLCCIDEFSRMRSHDKTVVHEALEQQTVSVAKAGIVCRLPCRTAVLAATNARGSYDVDLPLTVNTSLSAPLLSRFDLIFILRDSKNQTWDGEVADHILEFGALQLDDAESLWSVSRLRSYLSYCSRFSPKLSASASQLITRYYVYRRNDNNDIDSEGRTTTRLLDSLARLAQAHAKLMCRGSEANLMDAVQAVLLMEISRLSSTRLPRDLLFNFSDANASLLAFPEDPDSFLLERGLELLGALDLDDLKEQLTRECSALPTSDAKDDTNVTGSDASDGANHNNQNVHSQMEAPRETFDYEGFLDDDDTLTSSFMGIRSSGTASRRLEDKNDSISEPLTSTSSGRKRNLENVSSQNLIKDSSCPVTIDQPRNSKLAKFAFDKDK